MNPNIIPQYRSPEPSRTQLLSLRVAGLAVGARWGEGPDAIMHAVATEVGGFEVKPPMTSFGTEEQAQYVHRGVNKVATPLAQDETTRSATEPRYSTSADFSHASGTTREDAFVASANGLRSAENVSFRGKIARRLAARAIKGVGANSFSTKR
jgi:hypothetical protein